MTSRHGIVSPWAGLEPQKQTTSEGQTPRFGLPDDAMEHHSDPQKHYGDVVLAGRGFEIHINVPQANAQTPPSADFGKAVFGACLQELFKRNVHFEQALQKQNIFRERPLGPVSVLVFDQVTLFAKAGTLQSDLGVKMAVDRLVLSLLETVGWMVEAGQILQRYRVELVRKA